MQVFQQPTRPGQQDADGNSHMNAGLVPGAFDRLHGRKRTARDNSGCPHVDPDGAADIKKVAAASMPAASARGHAVPVPPAVARLAAYMQVHAARLVGRPVLLALVWLHLFLEQRIAMRALRVTGRHLVKAPGKQYFDTSDIPLTPVADCQPVFNGMHAESEKVLDGGAGKVRVRRTHASSESHLPPTINVSDQANAAAGVPALKAVAYEGVVTSAGRTIRVGPDGVSHNTFRLTLSDGVRDLSLFGTALERQSVSLGLRTGDRIRIVFMGKVRTEVPGSNRPAFRNLFQLARVDAP